MLNPIVPRVQALRFIAEIFALGAINLRFEILFGIPKTDRDAFFWIVHASKQTAAVETFQGGNRGQSELARDHDQVRTGKVAGDDRWPGHGYHLHLSGHQRRSGRRSAGYEN